MVEGVTRILFADREAILLGFLEQASDASTWISECDGWSEPDKQNAIVCLAEISGAARLAKKLLMLDKESALDALKKEFSDDIG